MRLFQRPDCPFCWKVRLVLAELGLSCDFAPADQAAGLSPQGTVPVLHDGDLVIWESSVIAEYLAEQRPSAGLMPRDAAGRARVRLLHTYSDRIAGQGLREVVFEKRGRPAADWDAARIEAGRRQWAASLDRLERDLGEGPYLAGAAFTLADCALIPRFVLAETYGAGLDGAHPRLAAWFGRVRARPAFSAACP